MGIKFRWPIYRTVFDEKKWQERKKKNFEISDEGKTKIRAMLDDEKQGKVSYEIPKTLSADELKMTEGAIARDVMKQLNNIAHNRPPLAGLGLGYKMGAGVSFREPIPPPTRTMKDSEEKPSSSPNELDGSDSTTATHVISEILLDLTQEVSILKKTFYKFLEKTNKQEKITDQIIKTLLLRLEDVESQLEGTYFAKDSENRPINLLAEDVATLKTNMGHIDKILALIGDEEQEPVPPPIIDIAEVGRAFKYIIKVLERGTGKTDEKPMKIVEPYVQHVFKIYPDLEMHPPLTLARFLYGLCTQPMIVIGAISDKIYFFDVDVDKAMTIASEVFGHKFLGHGKPVKMN